MRLAFPLLLGALVIASPAAQGQRFTVAIVRPDAALIPLATYDAGRWERAWPEADEATDITAIDAVPSIWRQRGDRVPNVWWAWPTSGSPIQAQANGVEVIHAHCSGQVALKTNLTEVKTELPFLAVDESTVPVGAVEKVPRADSMWSAAERAVRASFSKLETDEATRSGQQLPRETPAPQLQFTALFRESKSPRSPLYFVAEKKYRTPRSPENAECNALTVMTGWLIPTDAGTFTLLDAQVYVTDCDSKEVRAAQPLAVLRLPGQLFWVLQEYGYEDVVYQVAEITASMVRYPIEFNGGGC